MLRRDIEGLRAIAVGIVILYHAHFLGLNGGFIGVDVFFVLSGFLITSLLIREHNNTGRISLASFYARRSRRLLPASALVIAATAMASRAWIEPLRLRNIGVDAIAGGGFVSNIVFAIRNTDYLQAGIPPSPLQHFWSLSVEEQFYVVWPTLFLVLLWSARGQYRRSVLGMCLLSAASLTICVAQTSSSQPWAFFGLHARAWELGIGALTALLWPYIERIPSGWRVVVGWLGVIAIVVGSFSIDEKMLFPGFLALVPVLGAACALAGGDSTRGGPRELLKWAPLQWIGSRSYSLYLWHWPALIIAEGHAGRSLTVTERLGALLIAFGAAELSYRFIENPVRHAQLFTRRARPALLLGGALVVTSIGIGIILRSDSPTLATDVVAEAPTLAPATTSTTVLVEESTTVTPTTIPTGPPPDVVSPAAPLDVLAPALATEQVPSNMEPSLSGASGDKPEIYDNGCHVSLGTTTPMLCEYGDLTSDFTVALYGDSHAAQWFDAINAAAITNHWRLLVLTKLGCPPFDEITYNSLVGPHYMACRPWREAVLQLMIDQKVRVAFVASSNRLFDDSTQQPFTDSVAGAGYDVLISQFTTAGIAPILFTDTPYPGEDVPTCLSRNINRVSKCVGPKDDVIRRGRMQTVIDAAARNGVQYLDVENWVCTEIGCPMIVGNILVYRDSNHLTTKYVQFLSPLFDAAVSPYVNGLRSRISTS